MWRRALILLSVLIAVCAFAQGGTDLAPVETNTETGSYSLTNERSCNLTSLLMHWDNVSAATNTVNVYLLTGTNNSVSNRLDTTATASLADYIIRYSPPQHMAVDSILHITTSVTNQVFLTINRMRREP